MRLPWCLSLLCLSAAAAFAAAPPAKVPAAWLELIGRLGGDQDTRRSAGKKLIDLGEDVIGPLRRAAMTHADVDVRLRAGVLAAAIEKKLYGEVRRFTGHA